MFVRRCLSVSPFGMAVFTLLGWYEVLWMYKCLLVGLVCVLTSRRPLSLKFGPFISVLIMCEFDRGVDFVDVCDECV